MNKKILEKLGFGKELELVEQGKCPFCQKPITKEMFKGLPLIYAKEFDISHTCPECQNEVFGIFDFAEMLANDDGQELDEWIS
jgi:hypothetical protein